MLSGPPKEDVQEILVDPKLRRRTPCTTCVVKIMLAKAAKKAYGKPPTPWQMDAVTKAADLDGDRRGDRLGDRHGDHNVDRHGDGHAHRPTPPRPFTEPTGFEICTCWRLSFPTAKLNKEHDA